MDLGRRLAEGVGAWLQYQAHCDNVGMFSERFLTEPIGAILSSWSKQRVLAEFKHPVLQKHSTGSGRRPEIDFVVCNDYPKIAVAVESKWLGATRPPVKSLMWDLIRLELLAKDGAECYFLLGGTKRALDEYFERQDFRGPKGAAYAPLLRTDMNQQYALNVTPQARHRIAMVRGLVDKYQEEQFPSRILTRRTSPFPSLCLSTQHQVYVWNVRSMPKRAFFVPKNSTHYVKSGSTTRAPVSEVED
jgi:hypothetical protein